MRRFVQKTCSHCGNEFSTNTQALYCSDPCRKIGRKANLPNCWSKKEDEYIRVKAGTCHISRLISGLNGHNKKHGLPERTEKAIRKRAIDLHLSIECHIEAMNASTLACLLNVSKNCVFEWTMYHGLLSTKYTPYRRIIKLADFRKWAVTHYEMLYGCDLENLKHLLGKKLTHVYKLVASNPNKRKRPIRIARIDISPNIEYQSLKSASEQCYMGDSTLKYHVRKGKTIFEAGGYKWKVIQ